MSTWPIPDSMPRTKAFTYLLLICATAILMILYNYSFKFDNWTYKNEVEDSEYLTTLHFEITSDFEYDSSSENAYKQSELLKKLVYKLRAFNRSSTTVRPSPDKTSAFSQRFYNFSESYANKSSTEFKKNKNENAGNFTIDVKHFEVSITGTAKSFDETSVNQITRGDQLGNSTGVLSTSKPLLKNKDAKIEVTADKNFSILTVNTTSITVSTTTDFSTTRSETPTTVSISTTINKTSVTNVPQKGYLVYSQHCKIPDIDPMHPSIRHMIEKSPPLDCSKDHKALTRTENNFLILDEEAVHEKIGNENYTCCYKSIFRIKEGISDNGVGFGTDCMELQRKTVIQDEFITVECKYSNDTLFYQEFHSFIFDKPQVEKRCGNQTKTQYSVLIIGVDAMSRLNMHRQLNATANYLFNEMDAVEMYGFNKVGDNTFPNLIPMLVGYSEKELTSICWRSSDFPLDRCNFLWKSYAKKGYRTLYAEDSPHISSFNYLKDGFFHQPTDYYFRHFILAYEDALGRDKPLNCYKCVGSVSETEAVLQWTEKFASHFSKRPYFAFSWINSLTHDFLNMGSSGDQMYEKFFRTLHQSGALNKTIVVLMGDHGMRWGEIRKTYIGRLEERLPMLLIALPEEFKRQFPRFAETLKENSHRLVTPFDLHATLVHLLNLTDEWNLGNPDRVDAGLAENFTRRALSLFQPIPNDRSCDDAFIEEHWCTCESSLAVDLDNGEVKQVAEFLLGYINDLLKPESKKCANLTLESISDAHLWQPSLEHEGHSADDNIYTVIIHTDPSKAIFEGTVKISQPNSETTLLGSISRLNLYGNQSSCIGNAILRKYCYCL